jgi:hypothetical protein
MKHKYAAAFRWARTRPKQSALPPTPKASARRPVRPGSVHEDSIRLGNPLSPATRDRQNGGMDASSTPAVRPRRSRASSRQPRPRSAPAGGSVRSRSVARRLLVLSGAVGVFSVVFIVDPDSVGRLVWTCLAGRAGWPARLTAFGGLVALVLVIGSALIQQAPPPPPKPRKRAVATHRP